MTEDDHTKEKTGAELLSIKNMLPVPIRYKGRHSQPHGQEKMVHLYQSFVICKLWVHLVAEAVISGERRMRIVMKISTEKPYFFCLGGGL